MKLLFIVNEMAGNGKGKKVWHRLQRELQVAYELVYTQYIGHGQEIAQRWGQEAKEKLLIVVVGGDGTIHEVVSGVIHNPYVVIGVVPAGSGNDFARTFPTFQQASQINTYIERERLSTFIDIGTVNLAEQPQIFVNNAGIGFDAFVTKNINGSRLKGYLNKVGLGKLSYAAAVINALFHFKSFPVTIYGNNERWTFQRTWLVTMCNQPYFGGGMNISPISKPTDGQVEIAIVHDISPWKLLFVFATVFFGWHTKFKEFTLLQGAHFDIVVHAKHIDSHVDGNYAGIVEQETAMPCAIQEQALQIIKMPL
ncbi:diacylglycerol/lipid kinase family protein [Lysinibacillus piscis]|uniref:Diacylglycerol kinase n=1 Tax=Lysinibacillus piscis TaxID=2518931 RepID=A0ABQ5NJI2_9BACI|nr:diacylglycerol kinase family protein [Lysinibacillus sp. KH24]GLC88189.1 diacylglycerol kinase [Lysinibacillus sp. KH24]